MRTCPTAQAGGVSWTTISRYLTSGTMTSSCFFVRSRNNFSSSYGRISNLISDYAINSRVSTLTSVSSSWTRSPAWETKFHTIAASSSTPWSKLLTPGAATSVLLEKDPDPTVWVLLLVMEVLLFVLRMDAIWPLVFSIDPETRSRTIVALTPAFLERRPSVSSRASDPLLWLRGQSDFPSAAGCVMRYRGFDTGLDILELYPTFFQKSGNVVVLSSSYILLRSCVGLSVVKLLNWWRCGIGKLQAYRQGTHTLEYQSNTSLTAAIVLDTTHSSAIRRGVSSSVNSWQAAVAQH